MSASSNNKGSFFVWFECRLKLNYSGKAVIHTYSSFQDPDVPVASTSTSSPPRKRRRYNNLFLDLEAVADDDEDDSDGEEGQDEFINNAYEDLTTIHDPLPIQEDGSNF
ncbi:hypothetical protein QCA50_004328 [Cerrena zonata]|uniref:Uncharacterized protein n=1 Tax=Cerrena zonata TaxID=2478898 RepID=A0AAW0GTQ3_9APHY